MYRNHQQLRRVNRQPSRDSRSTFDLVGLMGSDAMAHVQLYPTPSSMTAARTEQLKPSSKPAKLCRRGTLLHRHNVNIRPTIKNATQPHRLVSASEALHSVLRYIMPSDIPSHNVRPLHANHLLLNLPQRTHTQIARSAHHITFARRRRCQAT